VRTSANSEPGGGGKDLQFTLQLAALACEFMHLVDRLPVAISRKTQVQQHRLAGQKSRQVPLTQPWFDGQQVALAPLPHTGVVPPVVPPGHEHSPRTQLAACGQHFVPHFDVPGLQGLAQATPGVEAITLPTRAAPMSRSARPREMVPLASPLAKASKVEASSCLSS
jgi:hypothetical protein